MSALAGAVVAVVRKNTVKHAEILAAGIALLAIALISASPTPGPSRPRPTSTS